MFYRFSSQKVAIKPIGYYRYLEQPAAFSNRLEHSHDVPMFPAQKPPLMGDFAALHD
jgi:hypothetical protein